MASREKSSLTALSEQTGASPSTVFRALNGCGGVTPEKAKEIRDLARKSGYIPPRTNAQTRDVAVILPEKPVYFWGKTQKKLVVDPPFTTRVFLFSCLNDTEGFLNALSLALGTEPRLIITAPPPEPEALGALSATGIPVFFFCEYRESVNAFYFGSDPVRDGETLAKAFSKAYPERRKVLLAGTGDTVGVVYRRTKAFFETLGAEPFGAVRLSDALTPYASSLYAREIAEYSGYDCVYCEDGILPTVCLAMDKCHVPPNIPCIGYENPPGAAKYLESSRIALTLVQDTALQADECRRAAYRFLNTGVFPDAKNTFSPSILVRGE